MNSLDLSWKAKNLLDCPHETPFTREFTSDILRAIGRPVDVDEILNRGGLTLGYERTILLRFWNIFDVFEIALSCDKFGFGEQGRPFAVTCADEVVNTCESLCWASRLSRNARQHFVSAVISEASSRPLTDEPDEWGAYMREIHVLSMQARQAWLLWLELVRKVVDQIARPQSVVARGALPLRPAQSALSDDPVRKLLLGRERTVVVPLH